MNKPILVKLA